MPRHVAVIGAGAVGRWSALCIARQPGHRVTLIDRGDLAEGCSFGNAGLVCGSRVVPLAAPGVVKQGLKWMLDSKSPFYIKPRASYALARWAAQFIQHATEEHVARSYPAMRDLLNLSAHVFRNASDPHHATAVRGVNLRKTGQVYAYQADSVGAGVIAESEWLAKTCGIPSRVLNVAEMARLEPHATLVASGGVLYPNDNFIDPERMMDGLLAEMARRRDTIDVLKHTEVIGVELHCDERVKAVTVASSPPSAACPRSMDVDAVVIAGGSWAPVVAKMVGDDIPILPGKGYSITVNHKEDVGEEEDGSIWGKLQQPIMMCDTKVAVSPFGDRTRFAGTLELTHVDDHAITASRVTALLECIPRWYPEARVPPRAAARVWHGMRPCTPDGLPFIGRSTTRPNVVYACGHNHIGVSLSAGTGHLVSQVVAEAPTDIDIAAFRPNRFG